MVVQSGNTFSAIIRNILSIVVKLMIINGFNWSYFPHLYSKVRKDKDSLMEYPVWKRVRWNY